MSRADRIVNRKAWFSSVGNWYRASSKSEGAIRKSFRRWLAEWRVFHTHDTAKIKSMIEQQKAFAEAQQVTNAEAPNT